jgi:hypothetical protein
VSYPSNQIDALLEQPVAFKSEYLLNEKYCSVQCFEAGVPEEGGGEAQPLNLRKMIVSRLSPTIHQHCKPRESKPGWVFFDPTLLVFYLEVLLFTQFWAIEKAVTRI